MNVSKIFVVAFLAGIASSAQAQSLPPIVQQAIAQARQECASNVQLLPGFISEKDINGDGRNDYILEYEKFHCGGGPTFCGSGGCTTQVFASRPDGTYVKALDDNVRGLRFTRVNGRPAMLIGVHGSACGRSGAEACNMTLYWNGYSFSPAN